jgi:protein-S-isoprenylcysteine O-methyltransferase Ste14
MRLEALKKWIPYIPVLAIVIFLVLLLALYLPGLRPSIFSYLLLCLFLVSAVVCILTGICMLGVIFVLRRREAIKLYDPGIIIGILFAFVDIAVPSGLALLFYLLLRAFSNGPLMF